MRNQSFSLCVISYYFGFILDFFDGFAARLFKQSSKFGGCLDMLTDRMATLVLVIMCIQIKEDSLTSYFVIWIVIDLTSHWMQTLNAASVGEHHKSLNNNFLVLNFYYTYQPFMFALCNGTELFFLSHFYKQTHGSPGLLFDIAYFVFLALMSVKGYVNVLQLMSNCIKVAEEDERSIKNN